LERGGEKMIRIREDSGLKGNGKASEWKERGAFGVRSAVVDERCE
jgi:hypothetical protein